MTKDCWNCVGKGFMVISNNPTCRLVCDVCDGSGKTAYFELAQIHCEPGGWSRPHATPTPEEIKAAEQRWARRSYLPEAYSEEFGGIEHQCGGCRYFAATGSDYGLCWHEHSPLDGMVVFEHGGCLKHSERESKPDEPCQHP